MSEESYRRIGLGRYVQGMPSPDDFRVIEEHVLPLDEGAFLVRNRLASIDPGTRGRMSAGDSYIPALALGETIGGFNVGEVVASRNERYSEGDMISCAFGWTEMAVSNGRGFFSKIKRDDVPLSAWIGILGVPGMTAYFGLHRVGELASGKTVVVTSAAGMVGATAAQIARNLDCRVVGIAGGPTKCGWLSDTLQLDAAIDYKAVADLTEAVKEACPDGVDILFDNVGNSSVDAILPLMNRSGRIVVSGQVGDSNQPADRIHGIRHTRPFITHRVRMEGLVVFDDIRDFPKAQDELADALLSGKLVFRERFYDGIESAPIAFRDVFEGKDFGRHLVRL